MTTIGEDWSAVYWWSATEDVRGRLARTKRRKSRNGEDRTRGAGSGGHMANKDTKYPRSEEVRMSSPLKRLTRKVFEHHSNPGSAWTRLLSVPLVFVPFWTRSWRHAALVGAWLLLNPVVFSEPEDDSAWATRAMLGEEMWIAERPLDKAMAVNVAASAFGIGGALASIKRRPLPTALCTVSEIALLLLYWRLMAEYYEEHRKDRG